MTSDRPGGLPAREAAGRRRSRVAGRAAPPGSPEPDSANQRRDAELFSDAQPSRRRRPGRAGRDLRAATLVGIVLAILVIGSMIVWKPAFVVLAAAAIVVAVWELSRALGEGGVRVPVVPVLLGSVLMIVAGYVGGPESLAVALGLTVVAVLVWRLGESGAGYLRDTTAGVFVAMYVPFLAGFATVLLRPEDGHWRVLALLAVVVASDLGGYLAGVFMGRHPMAPTVSPKKSWEGFAGSVVLGTLVGTAAVIVLLDGQWWAGVVFGLAGVIAATLGDLGESMIKRDLRIKDMSDLLPGHGGLMDRLDSVLTTAPIAWLVLNAFVEVS
ncbi:MAG TPA: phosphatidate cytidylyltransferase [Jiangellaceae bacterium]|nr:phosphatidate cytidylyltransferase [Jiangellaceae bacterium]